MCNMESEIAKLIPLTFISKCKYPDSETLNYWIRVWTASYHQLNATHSACNWATKQTVWHICISLLHGLFHLSQTYFKLLLCSLVLFVCGCGFVCGIFLCVFLVWVLLFVWCVFVFKSATKILLWGLFPNTYTLYTWGKNCTCSTLLLLVTQEAGSVAVLTVLG